MSNQTPPAAAPGTGITIPPIHSITAVLASNGEIALFGAGDDNKVYYWNHDAATWLPNYRINPAPAAEDNGPVSNRKARRARAARK